MTTFDAAAFDPAKMAALVAVDPMASPDQANAAASAVLAEPVPLLEVPPPSIIPLLAGWRDGEGTLHMKATVRELNGEDEEFIARETQTVLSPVDFVDLILRRATMALGPHVPTPAELDQLLIGDRLMLAMAIRRMTYGPDWEVEGFMCRICSKPFDVIIELDKDISIKPLKEAGKQLIEVALRHGHTAEVNLLNGASQKAALGDGTRTNAEEISTVIDKSLVSIDGVPTNGAALAKRMGLKDRHSIIEALNEAQPGPQMGEVSVPCSACGQTATYALNMVDLFR